MAKCSACGKFLSASGAVSCSTCPCIYHRGCVAIPENAGIPKDWICPECKKKQHKGDNNSTPVKGICGDLTPLPTIEREPTAPGTAVDVDIQAMRRELKDFMAEQRAFNMELRTSLATMTKRMDAFEQRLEELERKEPTSATNEVAELQKTVAGLQLELNDRDQEALQTDLEIGHLPEEKGENVLHMVTVLATKIGISLEERDIVYAERVGPVESTVAVVGEVLKKGRARRIVVRLVRRQLRDEFLRAARVRRNFNTGDIGLTGPVQRIYFNERLTKNNRLLFHRVREACRQRQWRYAWTRKGRIYARQSDGKQVYPIRSEADLNRVFGTDIV